MDSREERYIKSRDDFIKEIARRAQFTQKDVEIILDTIIEIFTDAVAARKDIFVRGFGHLYMRKMPPRKASKLINNGQMLPETVKVIFRLADTIKSEAKKARKTEEDTE